jgi:hypothetical protein
VSNLRWQRIQPAHGDDIERQAAGAWPQAGGQGVQGARHALQALLIHETLGRRMVGSRLHLDGSGVRAPLHQQVDLAKACAHVLRQHGVAVLTQVLRGEPFAARAGAILRPS